MIQSVIPAREDLRALLSLALPLVLVQVGMMLMGTVDTVMVGHLSADSLAAVALGNLYFFGVAIFGWGTLMALDPVIAQAVGAGDAPAVALGVQRGLLLAAALTVPASLLFFPAAQVFTYASQPPTVIPIAAPYTRISALGVLPFLAFVVLRQSLQAIGHLRPIVITILLANLVNLGLNWILIYGHFGAPSLGVVGSAWATVISRWLMAVALLALAWGELRPRLSPLRAQAIELAPLGRMLRLGLPIGIQYQLEYGVFAVVGLLMGRMGTTEVAGHQVALNLASLTFMVPLGMSAAAAVLVGHAVGREDAPEARRAARAAIFCSGLFMAGTALLFIALPRGLARVYTSVPEVIVMATTLLPIAGVFQVFDGLQVVSIGILRGIGDTRTPMLVNVLGFWLLGLPVSLYLGFETSLGPAGLWWGLVVGLVVVGIFLVLRVRTRLNRGLRRVVIDHHPSPVLTPDA